MKKNIYTGIFCTILGLCINTPANASLISRNFLDQALTDYATNTALDLKANQSDFTDLNTQISGSVDVLRQLFEQTSNSYELVKGINPEKFPNTISGAFTLLHQYLDAFAGSTLYGWTDSEKKTYLGVKGLNDKIGTLPSGDMLISKGLAFLLPDTDYTYPTSIGDFMRQMYNGYLGLSGLAEAVYHGNEFMGQTDTTRQVKGLRQITDEIGTLPSGNFPEFPESEKSFSILKQPLTYPTSLAELITALYGNSETSWPGLLGDIIASFPLDTDGDGGPDAFTGLIPNFNFAKEANDLANANATKIGTLPTEIPNMDSTWARYGFVETTGTPIDLPDTIGGMLAMLFNEDDSYDGLSLRNIMGKILMGFNGIEGLAKLTSAYKLIGDSPIVTAVNANTAKIGTLPDGYETVGAALSAIKGIAEEAKAAALAAIPDPKTEGSNGKYVLTVDIVGDNATYRWEPIDRGETTPTTE